MTTCDTAALAHLFLVCGYKHLSQGRICVVYMSMIPRSKNSDFARIVGRVDVEVYRATVETRALIFSPISLHRLLYNPSIAWFTVTVRYLVSERKPCFILPYIYNNRLWLDRSIRILGQWMPLRQNDAIVSGIGSHILWIRLVSSARSKSLASTHGDLKSSP